MTPEQLDRVVAVAAERYRAEEARRPSRLRRLRRFLASLEDAAARFMSTTDTLT